MTFGEALKRLNIEDYGERIFNSNSHGELFHLFDYIMIAQAIQDPSWFRPWFVSVVECAEKTWQRPESIFQHIPQALGDRKAPRPVDPNQTKPAPPPAPPSKR